MANKSPTSDELRQFLRDMGVSQATAAKYAHCSHRMMKYYCSGSHEMPAHMYAGMKREVMEAIVLRARGEIKKL